MGIFLIWSNNLYPTDVIISEGGSQSEIQFSIDSLGGEGVVIIPCGEWEFNPEGTTELTRSVVIPYSHVTVIGCGGDRTILKRSTGEIEAKGPFFHVISSDVNGTLEWVRITGLKIVGNFLTDYHEWGIIMENVRNFRVDHCRFENLKHSGVQSKGGEPSVEAGYGVVDHCSFFNIHKLGLGLGYGVAVQGNNTITGEPFGSEFATFIEDSSFSGCRHAVAANQGGRYVFRYNYLTNNGSPDGIQAIDAHGHEHPALPTTCGTEWIDVYENTVQQPSPGADMFAVLIRGGKGLVWNNRFRDYQIGVMLWENTDQQTGPVYIWQNTLPGGTMVATNGGTPTYYEHRPSGYSPYPYPHPIVTDMIASAGPDQRGVTNPEKDYADIFVDASNSTVEEGHSIIATTWYLDGFAISFCMRDIISAGRGTHYLLLELERDDGLREYDLAVIDVITSDEIISSPTWNNIWFVPVTGKGSVTFTLTPSQNNVNAYAALTGRHLVNAHEDNAIIVRANTNGFFDVRNGDTYQSDLQIGYEANTTYNIRIDMDIPTQTYDVYINGQKIAERYAFRVRENSIGQITAWHATGSLTIKDIDITGERAMPDPECIELPEPAISDIEQEIANQEIDGKDASHLNEPVISVDGNNEETDFLDSRGSGCGCSITR